MAHPYDDRYREEYRGQRGYGREDRNFLERAGDEVRSWFGRDDARHRQHGDDRERYERTRSERAWTGGERWQQPDQWRGENDRWGDEPDRWRSDPDRGRGEYDYGRSSMHAWNEPGYGRWTDEGRRMQEERWRAGEGSRDYGERWRGESGGMWGPATWSQSDRWRRESGDPYGDRPRESNWGAWPREEGSWSGQRPIGESRGYYEDDRGVTHRFSHRETSYGGRGMNYAGRGPKNYRRSDERIREEICDRLTDDWRVDASDMEVTVNNGQVTLSGAVHSRDEKRKAEDIVESIPGVHDVHNNLRVSQWDDRYGSGGSMGTGVTNAGNTASTSATQPTTTNAPTRR